jgi:hypothetical protein
VRTDDDVEISRRHVFEDFATISRSRSVREQRNPQRAIHSSSAEQIAVVSIGNRETFEQMFDAEVVLLGQDFSRRHERGLMTSLHRNQHRTHCNHGLSRTHIALQQPMHRMAFGEVFVDLNDCPSLSASEVIGKHLMKALHQRSTTITNNMSDSNSGSFEFSFAPNQFHLHA